MKNKIKILMCLALTVSCSEKNFDDDERVSGIPTDSMAQQMGDFMASVDDSGGTDGGFAFLKREQKMFARYVPTETFVSKIANSVLPQAHAASCYLTNTFGACTANQVIRDFQGCTIGGASFSGTVTFNFDDGNINNVCTIDSNGDSIARIPNFTINGALGGTFSVEKTGTEGQKITRTGAGQYEFTNDGIHRTLGYKGTILADWTTSTNSAISITGAVRNGRVANGGSLKVLNNKSGISCDFVPSNVTWSNACNCAVSGTWSATCSDGKSGNYQISGCGTGTLNIGGTSESVQLDVCYAL